VVSSADSGVVIELVRRDAVLCVLAVSGELSLRSLALHRGVGL